MQILQYDNSPEFLRRAAPVLQRNEAFTGLLYGVADRVGDIDHSVPLDSRPLLALVEQGGAVAMAAVMTPPHRLLLHGRSDTPEPAAMTCLIEFLDEAGRTLPGVLGPRPFPQAFADMWSASRGQRDTAVHVGRGLAMTVYELRQLRPPVRQAPGRCRPATDADCKLLEGWTDTFFRQVHGYAPAPDLVRSVAARLANDDYRIWEHDGQPVAFAARSRPTPTGMAINAVYTPAPLRGRGYASACVAALCAEILSTGRQFCTLFADNDNPTANGIYQRLGFAPLGEFVELDFE